MSEKPLTPIEIGLTAAIVAIEGNEPLILTASGSDGDKLARPCRSARSTRSRTAPSRSACAPGWKSRRDCGSAMSNSSTLSAIAAGIPQAGDTDAHVASIGYLALTRAADNASRAPGATFEPWYRFFPWEDWREARPDIIERDILPELRNWAAQAEQPDTARALQPQGSRPALFRHRGRALGRGARARPLRAAL